MLLLRRQPAGRALPLAAADGVIVAGEEGFPCHRCCLPVGHGIATDCPGVFCMTAADLGSLCATSTSSGCPCRSPESSSYHHYGREALHPAIALSPLTFQRQCSTGLPCWLVCERYAVKALVQPCFMLAYLSTVSVRVMFVYRTYLMCSHSACVLWHSRGCAVYGA